MQDHERMRRLVASAVKKYGNELLEQFPELSREDLIQEGMISALASMARYDSKRNLGTWIYRVVYNRLTDIFRSKTAAATREKKISETLPGYTPEATELPDDVDTSLPLLQFAGEVYRRAKYSAGVKRPGRGPQVYSPAQTATMIAIQRKLKASEVAMPQILSQCPDLLRIIHLDRIPSHDFFSRFIRKCRGRCTYNLAGKGYRAVKTHKGVRMGLKATDKLTEREAAEKLGISVNSLSARRREGKLPFPFQRIFGGAVRYLRADIEKYEVACTVTPGNNA